MIFVPFVFRFGWIVRAWAKRYAEKRLTLGDLDPELRADYIKRDEVLTAWVARHTDQAKRRHDKVMEQISARGVYVPMRKIAVTPLPWSKGTMVKDRVVPPRDQ